MRLHDAWGVLVLLGCGSRTELDASPMEAGIPVAGPDASVQRLPATGLDATPEVHPLARPDASCGRAVAFDTSSDDVYLSGVNGAPATGFTWDFWFKAATLPTSSAVDLYPDATLLTAADGVACEDVYVGFGTVNAPANQLGFIVDGLGECGARDTTPLAYAPEGGFATDRWYFVAVSHDYRTGASQLQLDNVVVAAKVAFVLPIPRILPLTVGRWTDRAVTQYGAFRGAIDEIHIYQRVLTTAEMSNEYNTGAGRYGRQTDVGLTAGYHFDEGVGFSAGNFALGGEQAVLEGTAGWAPGFICER